MTDILRVRVKLDGSSPPIWRQVDLRADLPLDLVHLVLQTVFGWENRHLYRFSVGGGPFEPGSHKLLCAADIAEGDKGLPVEQVSIGAVLTHPGFRLAYVYDYGDSWDVTLESEKAFTALGPYPAVMVVDGERAGPPEDCGGVTDGAELARLLDDPALFDKQWYNNILQGPGFTALTDGVHPDVMFLIGRLRAGPVNSDFAACLPLLGSGPTIPDDAELRANVAAFQWFLDRGADGGIPLTSASYMKPEDVVAASAMVPAMGDWIGKNNREVNCEPLLRFREMLQSLGLLRKHKGALLTTKVGLKARNDPAVLWQHLASRLVPTEQGSFERHATILLLTQAGGAADGRMNLEMAAAAMDAFGWRLTDYDRVPTWLFHRLPAHDLLINVADRPRSFRDEDMVSPAAAALARAALRR
ncbi:plasmid pRiA4b ORF-3 family protein [Mycobacterium sp. C31M]